MWPDPFVEVGLPPIADCACKDPVVSIDNVQGTGVGGKVGSRVVRSLVSALLGEAD